MIRRMSWLPEPAANWRPLVPGIFVLQYLLFEALYYSQFFSRPRSQMCPMMYKDISGGQETPMIFSLFKGIARLGRNLKELSIQKQFLIRILPYYFVAIPMGIR